MSHFACLILEKPENFRAKFFNTGIKYKLWFYLIFENSRKTVRIKSYNQNYRGRIPIDVHESARVKNTIRRKGENTHKNRHKQEKI